MGGFSTSILRYLIDERRLAITVDIARGAEVVEDLLDRGQIRFVPVRCDDEDLKIHRGIDCLDGGARFEDELAFPIPRPLTLLIPEALEDLDERMVGD